MAVAGVVEDFVAGEASLLDSTRRDQEEDEAHPPVPSVGRGVPRNDGAMAGKVRWLSVLTQIYRGKEERKVSG